MRPLGLPRPDHAPRPRRVALLTAAVAMGLSLLPTSPALAVEVDEPVTPAPSTDVAAAPTADLVAVRLRVSDRPVEQVTARRGAWPATLLKQHGVRTDGDDLVIVKRNGRTLKGEKRRLREGTLVRVIDVEHRTRVKKVKVAQRTVTKATTSLKPGRRKVVAQGRPAVHRVKIERVFHDGHRVERKVLSRKVVREAKPKRVLVGRKALSVAGADGLNWAGLARCESGGNPRAVNAAGYYGLYQFNVATWRSVGGSGMPHHATAGQQTFRAKLLYKQRGRQPWPHCGRYL